MLTIIAAIRPVPRRRSGFHRILSWNQPKAIEAITATRTAVTIVTLAPPIVRSPESRSMPNATIAPKVISSPWAKFVSPVVPKIIDRPSEAIASTREKTRPPTASWRPWVILPEAPPVSSPIGKVTKMSASSLIS